MIIYLGHIAKHSRAGGESLEVQGQNVGESLVMEGPLSLHMAQTRVTEILVVIPQSFHFSEGKHQLPQARVTIFFLLFIITLFCLLYSNWYTDVMKVFNPLPAILTLATFRTQHHLSQEEILNKVGFNCFQVNTIQHFIFRSDNKIKPLFSISGIPL